jgi:cytoskeletal protein RodZ
MVRSRAESSAEGIANLSPASVPDLGRSLRLARELADLTVTEAAERVGLNSVAVEALENGNVGLQHDRIETLRALRTYANSLGLPGNDYVLVAVEHWPSLGLNHTASGDTAVVPVVSISSAPAGGHSPVGGLVSTWPGDATGVADATTTGAMEPVRPLALNDTGQVAVVDTGQVPAVSLGAPRFLKFMVGLVAFLIVLGVVGLVEHTHLQDWAHDGRSSATRWINDAKSAVGITTKSTTHTHSSATHSTTPPKTASSKVTMKADPTGLAEAITVKASSFTVKVVALTAPCWVEATTPSQPSPLFEQVLPAGQSREFTVTPSMATTIETGSSAGRAYIYQGTKQIGSYVPTKVPFKMNFTAVS